MSIQQNEHLLKEEPALNELTSPHTINLELPAVYKYLNVVGACIRALLNRKDLTSENSSEWLAYQVELAVQEACTNIIDHAYAGSTGRINVTLSLWEESKHLSIDLYDTGTHFDPALLRPIELDEPKTSGYGLFLMEQLMEKVTYRRGPGGNHWRLEKKL
jgi:serine/threonine-protein kinase RsbW